jgi:plastocyanin
MQRTSTVWNAGELNSFLVEFTATVLRKTVPETGKKTVTIKLRAGKYKFYCQPHESSMFGFIKVT